MKSKYAHGVQTSKYCNGLKDPPQKAAVDIQLKEDIFSKMRLRIK